MTMGERIKHQRIFLGLSQEELGAMVGVQKAAIYKYENGLVVNLKRSMIEKLAAALNVLPSYLLGFNAETAEKDNKPIESDIHSSNSNSQEQKILSSIRELNEEGQEKAMEYIDDLISSGKYKKYNQCKMVEDA